MKLAAIDIGTSRVKVAVFNQQGRMLHIADRRLERTASPDTQNACEWGDITEALLRELTASYAIDAVSLTGNMHSLLGIDAEGNPVADAELWSDNSAIDEAAELGKRYNDYLLNTMGNRVQPLFPVAKMLRMARNNQDCFSRVHAFLQSKDYIGFRLTGECVTDPSDASGTLMMNLKQRQWDHDWISEIGLKPEKMPEIRPSIAERGRITEQAAKRTGLTAGTPVFCGCGDLASAALGSGCDNNTFSLTLGTSGQLLASGPLGHGDKLAGKLYVFAHADPSSDLYLGSVPAGGFNFEWLAHCHNVSMDRFFELANACYTSADLPLYFPFLMGQGAPRMTYVPEGGWQGLSAHHGPAELFRAAVLGTLSALKESADLFETLVGSRQNMVLQALACREEAVQTCACQLFHQQKFLPANSEASLLGAALLGLTGSGVFDSVEAAIHAIVRNHPLDRPSSPIAQQWFRRYCEAVQRLSSC